MADATIENTIKPKRTYIKKKDKPSVENSNDTNKPKRAYRKKIKVPLDDKTVNPPAEKMEELPAEKMEELPAEKMEEPPAEKTEEPPAEKTEEPPAEKKEEPPAEKMEEPPAEKMEEPPAEKTVDPLAEKIEEPPAETKNENRNIPLNKSNKKKSLPAKYEKFLLYGVHLLKHIIDSEQTIDIDNILSISKIGIDVDSQIQFVDSFMNQIKNTKSFVKNYNNNNNNNNNNNPFVDSLVKLANLNVNENENDQIHCQVFEFNKQKYLIDQHFNVRPLDNSNSIIGKFDIVSMNVEFC